MQIYTRAQIEQAIDIPSILNELEKGFILYSQNKAEISLVGHLQFNNPPGDVHIKSGALLGEEHYVVKVASGFYQNPQQGLSSSNGLMLLFSQKTGEPKAILCDEGHLTNLRTALAGAIAAKYLAKHPIQKIGIIGTGIQAREQLDCLRYVTDCREVCLWGRDVNKARAMAKEARFSPFHIEVVESIDHLAEMTDLIVTTTASQTPLLFGHQLRPGTHVTATGADGSGKQELDPSVFEAAEWVALDSKLQCSAHGDFSYAKNRKLKCVKELGKWIEEAPHRPKDAITVADLTGVAIQDLQIAKSIYATLIASS
jgi:ornithine cyclodeaminase